MPGSVTEFAARTRRAAKVAVVDLGFLGDAIHLIPSLWALRAHYADADLHLISTPPACEAVGLTRCVDRCWPLELLPESRSWGAHWRLIRAIRRERLDVVLNLNAADRSILLTGLLGARERLGLLGGRPHAWNRLLIPRWLPQPDRALPVLQQRLHALSNAGFAVGAPRFDLEAPADDQRWASERVPSGAVHMSLCSGNPLKEWPLEHHARLTHLLLEQWPQLDLVISASGRTREQQRLDAFAQRIDSSRLHRLPPDLSLAQLTAVLQRCRLHIGPDSGVIHLAMALDLPTVAFFRRRGDGWRAWIPPGPHHHAFLQDCTCPHDHNAPCATAGVPRCLEALSPVTLLEACREVLGEAG